MSTEAVTRAPWERGPDWEAAVAYGVDTSLLLANLELTVEQRIEQLHRQTQLFEMLRPRSADDARHP
ncbi:MAG: hypothetical protein ACI9WU_002547 [Myxococcota bacterium]|jgi:hypothetical protein